MSFTKPPSDGDRMMDKKINTLVGIFLVTVGLTTREVRAEPVVYIGGSDTGISSTLMKVIWETNTWKNMVSTCATYFLPGVLGVLARGLMTGRSPSHQNSWIVAKKNSKENGSRRG